MHFSNFPPTFLANAPTGPTRNNKVLASTAGLQKKVPEREGGGTVPLLIFQAKWGCGRKKPEIGGTYVYAGREKWLWGEFLFFFPPPPRERARAKAKGPALTPTSPLHFFGSQRKFFFEIVRKGKGRGAALKKNRREE